MESQTHLHVPPAPDAHKSDSGGKNYPRITPLYSMTG
jgi:hypothetical protein